MFFIFIYDEGLPLLLLCWHRFYGNYHLYFIMGRVCITVNLLIDQIIFLYLLSYEIICPDDENFMIGLCFGGVTYLLALSLSICTGVTFQ